MEASVLYSGLALLGIILAATISYLYWLSYHWKRKGVPSYGNVITGVFKEVYKAEKSVGVCLKDMYFETKPLKYYGTFVLTHPTLVIQDKEIIKLVLLKDYFNFSSHGLYYDKKKDPLSANLFALAADDWKFMRTKLKPAFTSGKVKCMFTIVQSYISCLHKAVDEDRDRMENLLNVRDLLGRLNTDIIASVAFGIESHSLEDSNSVLRRAGKAHLKPDYKKSLKRMVRWNTKLSKLTGMRATTPEINRFFMEVIAETVQYREENKVRRNDFLDLLIELKNEKTKTGDAFLDKEITVKDIAAQSFVFFIAGFETSASTVSFALFEMAKNPEIKRKVQEECDKVMAACGGEVTYEAIQSMEYTDRVLHESMRMYPALCFLPRCVTNSCKLPTTDVFLEKGTNVWIPLLALHMDEEHFANPEVFDPERFNEENKINIPPYAYMPFGDGPRHCIAMRFALIVMKSVFLELMTRYNVELPDGYINRPVEFHSCTFISATKHGLMLKFTPRSRSNAT